MEKLINIIASEYSKYEKNPDILFELQKIIEGLPSVLELQGKQHERRKIPNAILKKKVMGFLNHPDNQYFYINSTDSFVKYDGKHYIINNEDDIWHAIYTYLKGCNADLKQQVKNNVIKYIKTKSIFKSIPESKTIQDVIKFLYPLIFSSKEEAKYFLSIIGDNITGNKINSASIIHYLSYESKSFVDAIYNNIHDYVDIGYFPTIKWRCYRHNFQHCRMLKFNKTVISNDCWNLFIKNNILDIVAVAAHYSERYNGSENYVTQHLLDAKIKNHIFYLKDKTEDDVVNDFVKAYIFKLPENNTQIVLPVSWDMVYFVWKMYLAENNYPNFLFIEPLKKNIKSKFDFDEYQNVFTSVSSHAFDKIIKLQSFWRETIMNEDQPFCDYEIGEICNLYRQWLHNEDTNLLIDQETMISVLQHFYPKIFIMDNKYVKNIKCNLWCKWQDINLWIDHYKTIYDKEILTISISALYHLYCNFKKNSVGQNNSVSKDYFTKYLKSIISLKFFDENLLNQSYFD
jgi:hypothetical protein